MHGIQRIENGIKFEKGIKDDVKNIEQKISTRIYDIMGDINLKEDYYYIDLNNIYSIKINDEKSVILNGFSYAEAEVV